MFGRSFLGSTIVLGGGGGGSVVNDTSHNLICDKEAACIGWC